MQERVPHMAEGDVSSLEPNLGADDWWSDTGEGWAFPVRAPRRAEPTPAPRKERKASVASSW